MKLIVTTVASLMLSIPAIADINKTITEEHPAQFIAKKSAEQALKAKTAEVQQAAYARDLAAESLVVNNKLVATQTTSVQYASIPPETNLRIGNKLLNNTTVVKSVSGDDIAVKIQETQKKTDTDVDSKINEVEMLVSQINSKDDELSKLITELSVKKTEEKKQAEITAKKQAKKAKAAKAKSKNVVAKKATKKKASAKKQQKYTPSSRSLSRNAAPMVAARKATRNSHSRSLGKCARYVRIALQSAGYRFTPNPSAYQYATRGTLKKAGFVKINNNSKPQIGDIVVVSRSRAHPHGHMSIYNGKIWVSDFRQKKKSPYKKYYKYTTWRDARYLNGAKAQGLYLAKK